EDKTVTYRVSFTNANLQTNPITFSESEVTSGYYLVFEDYQTNLVMRATDWNKLIPDEKNVFLIDCLITWSLEGFPYQLTGIENPEGALLTGINNFFTANPDKVLTEAELLKIAGSSNVLNIPG
ncbi:MAG TPA: hypothetical protein DDY49_05875, partial [Paenibacillaceae bacterium]|nr:hypothetical protein [Paenibacillaceae bacterium]